MEWRQQSGWGETSIRSAHQLDERPAPRAAAGGVSGCEAHQQIAQTVRVHVGGADRSSLPMQLGVAGALLDVGDSAWAGGVEAEQVDAVAAVDGEQIVGAIAQP